MRVITGTAKGIRLKAPAGNEARPPLDMLKGALFSILGDSVEGRRVLDLFAGSGSLGIEALSRGALHATFVEKSRRCVPAIEENLEKTRLSERARIRAGEAWQVLRDLAADEPPFDLVFLDPPFQEGNVWATNGWPRALLETLLPHLSENAIVVFRAEADASPPETLGPLALFKTRAHGRSGLAFYARA